MADYLLHLLDLVVRGTAEELLIHEGCRLWRLVRLSVTDKLAGRHTPAPPLEDAGE